VLLVDAISSIDDEEMKAWIKLNSAETYKAIYNEKGEKKPASIMRGDPEDAGRMEFFLNQKYQDGWKLTSVAQAYAVFERLP